MVCSASRIRRVLGFLMEDEQLSPFHVVRQATWRRVGRHTASQPGERALAEEIALALTFDGATYAVLMGTPLDLEDFAYGFSLTEGIITHPRDIDAMDVAPGPDGIDIRVWLSADRGDALVGRRRRMTGPVGCGLCGIETLREANRTVPVVMAGLTVKADDVIDAVAALRPAQLLNQTTHAMHAAAFYQPGRPLLVREDVGRHNALDKLAGALARAALRPADGILLMTSRLSVELVQKAAVIGCGVLIAISAPTTLALRTAEAAGITLVGVARADGFEVFTHAWRLK
jgi:FdhD protein